MHIGKYEASERSQAGAAITFLLMGLGAGALIALLYAPKSGKQLRRDLRRKYEDAVDAIGSWSEEARERAEDAVGRGVELAEELRDAARERVGPFARAVRRS